MTGVFVERSTSMRLMDEENMMWDELESSVFLIFMTIL